MIDFQNPDLHDQVTLGKTFRDIPLDRFYVSSLEAIGYCRPTPVQYYSISHGLMESTNLIVQSKSGTGKTLAYTSICLQKIFTQKLPSNKDPVVLILQPTRELAVQVYQNIRKILASCKKANSPVSETDTMETKALMNKIKVHLSIGGLPIEDDRKKFVESGCHICIGTTGRIHELVSSKILKLSSVHTVVLDEGDKLFQQSDSINKVRFLLEKTGKPQILVYSATYSSQVILHLNKLGEFKFIRTMAQGGQMKVGQIQTIMQGQSYQQPNLELANITKLACCLLPNEKSLFTLKMSHVKEMLQQLDYKKCLVFVEKKAQIPQVHQALKSVNPLVIHGSLSQASRIKLMNQLNSHRVIITSDLLARGIDIVVDLIILFNCSQGDNFWHRVGRTGRIGRKGLVVSMDHIQGWEGYSKEKASKALQQCQFVQKKQVFGEYMTEMGNWMNVDFEIEQMNINNYRYFDQQVFHQNMISMIEEDQHLHLQMAKDCMPPIPTLQVSPQELSYIESLLKCKACRQNLAHIQQATGYKFQVLKMIQMQQ